MSVRITARGMGLSTDAPYAFERGCDSEGIAPALKRLAYLAGGSAGTAKDTEGAPVIGLTNTEAAAPEKLKSEEIDAAMGSLLESLKGKHGIQMAGYRGCAPSATISGRKDFFDSGFTLEREKSVKSWKRLCNQRSI